MMMQGFSLALHIGHNVAGKKPVIAGAITLDGGGIDAAMERFNYQAHLYEKEMEYVPEDRQEPIRQVFTRLRGGH